MSKGGAHPIRPGVSQTGQPDKLSQYYYDAYAIYRKYCPTQYFIVAPEIFYEIPGTYRQHFMANSSYTKVLQDIHECVLGLVPPVCQPRASACRLLRKMPFIAILPCCAATPCFMTHQLKNCHHFATLTRN